jgi:hypothetical protein
MALLETAMVKGLFCGGTVWRPQMVLAIEKLRAIAALCLDQGVVVESSLRNGLSSS